MPTTPRATTRVVLRWAATVAVLAGLFAMHGLPMHQPGAAMGHTMATAAARATAPDLLPTAAGCSAADHCTAILRADVHLATPAPPANASAAADTVRATPVLRAATQPPRAPPDLSALGISRT